MQIKRGGGGFTLAELLIVMAIIVVLAAIAIPTFGKQLETARETADANAVRAAATDAFTEAYAQFVTTGGGTAITKTIKDVKVTQKGENYQYITPSIEIGGVSKNFVKLPAAQITAKKADYTFEFEPGTSEGEMKLNDIKIGEASVNS